ncbi:MAG: hypothetical protein Q9169_001431 [Polycauliona sp. 2 TL-2023]
MHRVAARYELFSANLWSLKPQRVAQVLQAQLHSNHGLSKRTVKNPKQRHQKTFARGQRGRVAPEGSQVLSADVLRFRQETDLISRDLPANPENLRIWIAEFVRLGRCKLLESQDSAETARLLHNLYRKYRSKEAKFEQSLHGLIETVRQAFTSGSVPSAAQVPLHLISYYKESGHLDQGIELWKWLSDQDDAVLDPVFVGPAIELLAVYGVGLQHCEEVFQRILHQQENIGSQYQLQSGAIVPDRSKAITIRGTSLSLLQGILSARLLYGKWRTSYLAVDTAFRLHPTQIAPRFLDLFVYERPIFEALPVFFMFCRGGNRVSKVTLAALLDSLKKLAERASSQSTKVGVVRAMLQVVEAYTGSAGVLNTRHLNILTRAVVCAMPRVPVAACTESAQNDKNIVQTVIDIFKQLFALFAQHNALPDPITFNGTIPAALSLGYPLLSRRLFKDMVTLDLSPNVPTAQSLLTTAGLLQDPELLEMAWQALQNAPSAEPRVQAVDDDFVLLAEAGGVQPTRLDNAHSSEDAWPELLDVLYRMADFAPGDFRDFHNHPLDETNKFTWPSNARESWQRNLYDELTRDKNYEDQHPTLFNGTDKYGPSAISNTGIRFDELRYLNWKSINGLLLQAQHFDMHEKISTDAAIQDRRASSKLQGARTTNPTAGVRYAITTEQLDNYQDDINKEKARKMDEDDWRAVILELRKPESDLLIL